MPYSLPSSAAAFRVARIQFISKDDTMRLLKSLVLLAIVLGLLTACVAPPLMTQDSVQPTTAPAADTTAADQVAPAGPGPGFGRRSNMMERHHAVVPPEYANLENPIPADAESLARGQTLYTVNCESCHGVTGMGEGPAGQALDPAPAPVAHTSQMMSDGYLFWRISEGGHPFETAMPVWKDALDEQSRWDLINYMRGLGSGAAMGPGMGRGMGQGMGRGPGMGQGMDQAAHRTEMLAAAVAAEIITQEEADFFERVHQVLDERYGAEQANMEGMGQRGMMTMQRALTDQAVRDGAITQEEADRFTELHDRVIEAGVMQ